MTMRPRKHLLLLAALLVGVGGCHSSTPPPCTPYPECVQKLKEIDPGGPNEKTAGGLKTY